jgi:hypothetical protein
MGRAERNPSETTAGNPSSLRGRWRIAANPVGVDENFFVRVTWVFYGIASSQKTLLAKTLYCSSFVFATARVAWREAIQGFSLIGVAWVSIKLVFLILFAFRTGT